MSLYFFGRGYILKGEVKFSKTLRRGEGAGSAQKNGGLTDLVFFRVVELGKMG